MHWKTNIRTLEIVYYTSKNTNLKSAYSNAQLQLENTNTTLDNVNSALSTGQPQSEVNNRINAAQAQLLIAQKSMNNVTSYDVTFFLILLFKSLFLLNNKKIYFFIKYNQLFADNRTFF